MASNKVPDNNPLSIRLGHIVKRIGLDKHDFVQAAVRHLQNVNKYVLPDNPTFKTREELIQTLISKFFIDNLSVIYPLTRFGCKVDENFDWPFDLYPSEVFPSGRLPDYFRTNNFYECLKVADVLDCRVVAVQNTEYHLRVIHKYGSTRYLDGLNILAVLSRSRKEMGFLEKGVLAEHDLIRAAVSEIRGKAIKVTFEGDMLLVSKQDIELGEIESDDLPSYVLQPMGYGDCKNLNEYLLSQPAFNDARSHNRALSACGININKVFSFIPSLYCLNNKDRSEELKESQEIFQKHLEIMEERKKIIEEKQGKKEEDQNKIDDDNEQKEHDKTVVTSLTEGLEPRKVTVRDCEVAYHLNSEDLNAREQLSKALGLSAHNFFKQKNYPKAHHAAENAVLLNTKNTNASAFLNYLRKNYPASLMNKEDPVQAEEMQVAPKIKQEPESE